MWLSFCFWCGGCVNPNQRKITMKQQLQFTDRNKGKLNTQYSPFHYTIRITGSSRMARTRAGPDQYQRKQEEDFTPESLHTRYQVPLFSDQSIYFLPFFLVALVTRRRAGSKKSKKKKSQTIDMTASKPCQITGTQPKIKHPQFRPLHREDKQDAKGMDWILQFICFSLSEWIRRCFLFGD